MAKFSHKLCWKKGHFSVDFLLNALKSIEFIKTRKALKNSVYSTLKKATIVVKIYSDKFW
jgi:hypothetical protein